jgi:hypothetical protein
MSAAPLVFSPSHNIWPVTGSDTPVVGSWICCATWVRQVRVSALAGQGPGSDDVTRKTNPVRERRRSAAVSLHDRPAGPVR